MAWATTATFNGHRGAVYALCGLDGGRFLSGGGDGLLVRWHLERPDEGELLADVNGAVFALARSNDDALLYAGDEHGGLHVIDLRERREVLLDHSHRKGIFCITPLADGRLACAGGDGVLSIWSTDASRELRELRRIPLSEGKLRGHAWSPDGRWLAVACADGNVRVLDASDLNELHTLKGASEGVSCVAWHPRKPVLLAGGKDGHLRLWHSGEDFRPLHTLAAHSGTIYGITFNSDASLFATAGRDKTAKLWDANTMDAIARLDRAANGHTHSVNTVCWLGDRLLTGGDDKRILAWGSGREE